MRVFATQFGILFALLAFSSQTLAGKPLGLSVLMGCSFGALVFSALLVTDTAIDRYLTRKYGVPQDRIDNAPTAHENGSTTLEQSGGHKQAA